MSTCVGWGGRWGGTGVRSGEHGAGEQEVLGGLGVRAENRCALPLGFPKPQPLCWAAKLGSSVPPPPCPFLGSVPTTRIIHSLGDNAERKKISQAGVSQTLGFCPISPHSRFLSGSPPTLGRAGGGVSGCRSGLRVSLCPLVAAVWEGNFSGQPRPCSPGLCPARGVTLLRGMGCTGCFFFPRSFYSHKM